LKYGHYSTNCPNKPKKNKKKPIVCEICNEEGHYWTKCHLRYTETSGVNEVYDLPHDGLKFR